MKTWAAEKVPPVVVRALCQKHLPKQEAAAADGTDGDALRANIAACFQSRAVQHLSQRVERALRWAKEASEQAGTPLQGMVVAGGVAANNSGSLYLLYAFATSRLRMSTRSDRS